MAQMQTRRCSRCQASEDYAMLALSNGVLVCDECDSEMEAEWVAQDPEHNRHSLDTFSPDRNWRGVDQWGAEK
jgi:hypothetical protein